MAWAAFLIAEEVAKSEKYPDLPDHLWEQAVDLREYCIAELAWKYPIALDVIRHVADKGHLILGGDAYSIERGSPEATGDSWYVNTRADLSRSDLVELGRVRAIEYIEAYHSRNGDGFLYSIVAAATRVLWEGPLSKE